MKKHFVTFFSPGTFFSDLSEHPIDKWDVDHAQKMASKVKERHGATPYAFQFTTRERKESELDSRVTKHSPMYYLPHCKVETLEEIEARNDPKESILRGNMRCNDWDRVVTTTQGWKWTQPLSKDDVVLSS